MLEWTHDSSTCPARCADNDTDCKSFPTPVDRLAMTNAAFEAYAEADGTPLMDFVQDVMALAISRGVEPTTLRAVLSQARKSIVKIPTIETIRKHPQLGIGTCSVFDECYSDEELAAAMVRMANAGSKNILADMIVLHKNAWSRMSEEERNV